MKISKLALIALLGGALMAFGCSDDTSGTGGTAGSGGGAGEGGGGGTAPLACIETENRCTNGDIDPTVACCELPAPPDVADACTGDESLTNPASCEATGTIVTHQLTLFEILGDCNDGYDLDGCNGTSCLNGGLAPGEGENGVDNGLAGLAPTLVTVGGNLGGVNQAFSDALCGQTDTDDPADGECETEITPLDIAFAVDANLAEGCANVGLIVDGTEAGSVILNVSDATEEETVCASGTLGTIPVEIGGTAGTFDNAVIRLTIAPTTGFANGKLGATVGADTAVAIAEALLEGAGAVVTQVFDISDDLSGDNSVDCNSVSGTYAIGGVVTGVVEP